ncbi:MAG: Stf0 family sulfotransferase, partial [Octadecabacter sp.]
SYVICTVPRSGSTMLCKMLGATGVAGLPESYFHGPTVADWMRGIDLTATGTETLADIFAAVRDLGTAGTGVFGLRMQRGSFTHFREQARTLYTDAQTDRALFQAAFGDVLFIHLTRRDRLEQAISWVMASQTGLWHRSADGTELERLTEPALPAFDADEIAAQMARLSRLDAEWDHWFAAEGITPHPIAYEDLAHDPRGELGAVLGALGLDCTIAENIAPATARLANATSLEWSVRFLAARSKNTGAAPPNGS